MRLSSVFLIGVFFGLFLVPIAISAVVEITIEYAPGSSLSVEIVNYPSSTPPSSSIYLTSKVTNTGSGNATNVWLAWRLPSGWNITSGTSNFSIGTLQPNRFGWNNITVTVGSTTGTYTVTASGNSSEGVGMSVSKTIEISETAPPPPPPGPTGGGEGGGGVLPTPAMSLILDPSILEVYQTKSISTILRVKNVGTMNLNKVRVNITGLEAGWYSIEPSSYNRTAPNEEVAFTISFNPPQPGTFGFKINVISNEKSESIDATLIVKELTPEAEKEIEEKEKEEERKAEAISSLNIIQPLLIVAGILGPAIIAVYMLMFLSMKRCPLCGGRMKVTYKGEAFTEYRCSKCKHFEIKEKGKK